MRFLLVILLLYVYLLAGAQLTVRGTVYDISAKNLVEDVRVVSTGGMFAITDSMGRYAIPVNTIDSLSFVYNNKPTQKFSVAEISNPDQFDISLHIPVQSRFTILKEVKVYSHSYRQDSIENRQAYAEVFDYRKPGIHSSLSPSGVAGADLGELINIFRFRRNRQLNAFQKRLEAQEQDKYVDYRFSRAFVKRVTGLSPPALDSFITIYRPTYEFVRTSTLVTFNQYVLDAAYRFKRMWSLKYDRKEEVN